MAAAVTYDEDLGATLMFGGYYYFRHSPSGYYTTGGTTAFDGVRWFSPGVGGLWERIAAELVFDSTRRVNVVAGGHFMGGTVLNDVWESVAGSPWQFRGWTLPSGSSRLLNDPRREGVFMFDSNPDPFDSAQIWNGESWTLQRFNNALPTGFSYSLVAQDIQRDVGVVFGVDERLPENIFVRRAGVWELRHNSWHIAQPMPPVGRYGAGLVWDEQRGYALLYGGGQGFTTRADSATWTYDGRSWTRLDAVSPSLRSNFGMCYDSRRGVIVMFGGRVPPGTSPVFAETWEWNGTAWTQRAIPGPTARSHSSLVYDRSRDRVVLFGGRSSSQQLVSDTWEYDGNSWTQRAIPGPSARCRHAMIYDQERGVVVLFGGGVATPGATYADTWQYDGTAWVRLDVPGPSARAGHSFVYEPDRQVGVLWAGSDGRVNALDTWEWDGGAWTSRTDLVIPRADIGSAATFDHVRRKTISFGGTASTTGEFTVNGIHDDTWTLGSPCPTPDIQEHPRSTSTCFRGSASLHVATSGFDVFWYQWRSGDSPRNIDGATSPVLVLDNLTAADLGPYDCVITSAGDCFRDRVVSERAFVTVCTADFNCDAIIDDADYATFVGEFDAGDPRADVNADASVDFFDYDDFIIAFEAGC